MKQISPVRPYDKLIVVMGNTNDEDGLSLIAKERCDAAIELWRADNSKYLIATGTFGGHFNTTDKPHFQYIKEYLYAIEPAIELQNKLLPGIKSTNTFRDILGLRNELFKKVKFESSFADFLPHNALKTRKFLIDIRRQEREPTGIPAVEIVTSDFHYSRVKFYCDLILFDFPGLQDPSRLKIVSVTSALPAEEKSLLIKNEEERIHEIMTFPEDVYKNANDEQKHYDNVSNWMITALLASFGLGYKYLGELPKAALSTPEYWAKQAVALGLFIVITFFWMLYVRAAATARTARKTIANIERNYSQFGFSLLYSNGQLKDMYFNFKKILELLYIILSFLVLGEVGCYFVSSFIFLLIYFMFFFDPMDR